MLHPLLLPYKHGKHDMLYGKDLKEFIFYFWLVVNRSKQQSIQDGGVTVQSLSFLRFSGWNGRRPHLCLRLFQRPSYPQRKPVE